VELAHSELDRHGENWRKLRDGVDSGGGWEALLARYGEVLAG